MSGQMLSDVISLLVTRMLERNTFGDRVQEYVVRVSDHIQINTSIDAEVEIDLTELPLPNNDTDPVLSCLLHAYMDDMDTYLKFYARRNRQVPKRLIQSDSQTLDHMLSIVVSWLNKHRYSTQEQLIELGLSENATEWFISSPERDGDYYCLTLLILIFRDMDIDCSISVWRQLVDLMCDIVERMRETRVYTLTQAERETVCQEALVKKRREVHPESFT